MPLVRFRYCTVSGRRAGEGALEAVRCCALLCVPVRVGCRPCESVEIDTVLRDGTIAVLASGAVEPGLETGAATRLVEDRIRPSSKAAGGR